MRRYVRVIADGAETRIPARGRTIFIDSATADVLVTARSIEVGRKEGLGQVGPLTMSAGRKVRTGDVFDDVTIRNESGADNTVTVLIGFADFDAPLATVNVDMASGIKALAAGGANHGSVSIGTSAAVILAANTTRSNIVVQNLSANNLFIGIDSSVTVANGIRIVAGASATLTHAAAVWGIASGAASDIRFLEETI